MLVHFFRKGEITYVGTTLYLVQGVRKKCTPFN